ncbi:uncharacterized protein EI97DRAFT_467011 [Westerdykella ornata]|uniref:Btz domain-containing protein n=1 Tax=Westerdykella ornata TaxID=318751 RepID=A0A6A6JJU6_WESOR|nr:uncharacterized protein EI97DRAFT_467011 [Westerdykella ornata]KAF2276920.1 hypothetical protein EI97DRAFT_467011 [Westerdykella ornata]
MAPPRQRQRTTLARRRRRDEDGDDVSVATDVADDSQSDVSLPSDVDEDADADNSDLSEVESPPSGTENKRHGTSNGSPRAGKQRPGVTKRRVPSPPIARSDVVFTASRNTELMRNGLGVVGKGDDDEVVDFETGAPAVDPQPAARRPEILAERRRREHEEYKKKRDADPAFIPTRGAFFMHDQRSSQGQGGFRHFNGGRGGGIKGAQIGGPYSPANARMQSEATDAPWQHDLHETLTDPPSQPQPQAPPETAARVDPGSTPSTQQPQQGQATQSQPSSQPRNFSTTVHTHNAQVRVFLPGMAVPVYFQNVPIKQHTRLPNHRPPLRRDKPVRISLPPAPPRYIFPTVERSFIFIPRALRPNQQGFGRGRGRGFGSFGGGISSRRTSVYGGSVYSPSIAMSRRSSIAREMGRDTLVSPAGSVLSRTGGFVDTSRPVVRLPPGPRVPGAPPVVPPQGVQQPTMYPLPQKPAFRENWHGHLPMHQPRPQKTVSVAGIESPASMTFNPPPAQGEQPFHQQVPAHLNGSAPAAEYQQPPEYPHARHPSYPSQASTGTPLSNIPERAIHAPAFQPYQPGFQPQPYAMPPAYYYPPNGAQPYGMMPMPMFMPGAAPQQPGYVMPMPAPPAAQAPAPPQAQNGNGGGAAQAQGQAQGPPNLVPYESNGMTYYMDPAQLPMYSVQPMEGGYMPPQGSYAVPGMGGMMTPSPEGAAYYYPGQMMGQMGAMQGAAPVFYPTQ